MLLADCARRFHIRGSLGRGVKRTVASPFGKGIKQPTENFVPEHQVETAIRRQRILMRALIIVMVGLVRIAAAPHGRNAEFNVVTARYMFIKNNAGATQAAWPAAYTFTASSAAVGIRTRRG